MDLHSCISISKHITRKLVLTFDPPKTSRVLSFSLCKNSLPYLRLSLTFLNTGYKRYTLLVSLDGQRMPLLPFLSFLTSKDMSDTLILIWLLVKTWFGLFCDILICKYVSCMYLLSVKLLNNPDTVSLLVYQFRKF